MIKKFLYWMLNVLPITYKIKIRKYAKIMGKVIREALIDFSMILLQTAIRPIIKMKGQMSLFIWHKTCNFKEISYT
jgi:hypothetical protein